MEHRLEIIPADHLPEIVKTTKMDIGIGVSNWRDKIRTAGATLKRIGRYDVESGREIATFVTDRGDVELDSLGIEQAIHGVGEKQAAEEQHFAGNEDPHAERHRHPLTRAARPRLAQNGRPLAHGSPPCTVSGWRRSASGA